MTLIRAETKRAQLRQILLVTAIASGSTCFDALLAFQTNVNEQNFQKGRQYTSVSGSGQHSSFNMVGSGATWSQENVFGMSEEYFDILSDTLAANGLTDDGSNASTKAIFAAMILDDRFQIVTRRGIDVTLLGWPQVGQLGGPA